MEYSCFPDEGPSVDYSQSLRITDREGKVDGERTDTPTAVTRSGHVLWIEVPVSSPVTDTDTLLKNDTLDADQGHANQG